MGIYVFYFVIAVATALIWRHHDKRRHGAPDQARSLEIWLVSFVVVMIGVVGLMAFVVHAFFADSIAEQIGFPAGNPFQFEVAVANLGFGVLGVLCARYRDGFMAATILGASIYLLGCAYGHVVQWLVHDNTQPGNVGGPLIADILVPVATLSLLALHARAVKRRGAEPAERSPERPATAAPARA